MRSRILAIAAAVVTAVIIAFAVPALRGGGGENSLARAAENLQGQNMRIDFVAGATQGKEDSAVSAAGVVSADGSRGRLTMHVEVQGTKVTVRQLRVGGQVYVASSQLDKALPPGKRWYTRRAPPIRRPRCRCRSSRTSSRAPATSSARSRP